MQYERYIQLGLMLLLWLGLLSKPLMFGVNGLYSLMDWVITRIPFFRIG